MSIENKMIGIVMYLPRERQGSAEELLRAGGITPSHRRGDIVYGCWDALDFLVEADLTEMDYHRKLWIKFHEGDWLELRPFRSDHCPQEADGGMKLVYAMRDLCARLQPNVAMFLSFTYHDEDWLDDNEYIVLGNDIEGLLALRPSVLYVNEQIAGFLTNPALLAGREQIPIDKGLMVLPSTGWGRFV